MPKYRIYRLDKNGRIAGALRMLPMKSSIATPTSRRLRRQNAWSMVAALRSGSVRGGYPGVASPIYGRFDSRNLL